MSPDLTISNPANSRITDAQLFSKPVSRFRAGEDDLDLVVRKASIPVPCAIGDRAMPRSVEAVLARRPVVKVAWRIVRVIAIFVADHRPVCGARPNESGRDNPVDRLAINSVADTQRYLSPPRAVHRLLQYLWRSAATIDANAADPRQVRHLVIRCLRYLFPILDHCNEYGMKRTKPQQLQVFERALLDGGWA